MQKVCVVQREFIPRYWVISAAIRFKQGLVSKLTTPNSYPVPVPILKGVMNHVKLH